MTWPGLPDHWPVPGLCVLTLVDDGGLYVDRADPIILIAGGLLRGIGPNAHHDRPWIDLAATLDGDVLTLDAVNQRLVYRLIDYYADLDVWLAQWPD